MHAALHLHLENVVLLEYFAVDVCGEHIGSVIAHKLLNPLEPVVVVWGFPTVKSYDIKVELYEDFGEVYWNKFCQLFTLILEEAAISGCRIFSMLLREYFSVGGKVQKHVNQGFDIVLWAGF